MISLTKLKRSVAMQIRGSGEEYDFAFYAAINDVIMDLISRTSLEVDALDEGSPADIDVDEKYFRVFLDGVVYYMQKNALWARKGDELSDADYQRAFGQAQINTIEDEDAATRLNYEDEE